MKIGMISTWDVPCGIAGYTKGLVSGLRGIPDADIRVIPIVRELLSSPLAEEFELALAELSKIEVDVFHIQHEFSFFGESYFQSCFRFRRVLKRLRRVGKLFVTFHTLPIRFKVESGDSILVRLKGFLSDCINKFAWYFLVRVINSLSVTCVAHSANSRRQLRVAGIAAQNLVVIPLGVDSPKNVVLDKSESKIALGYSSSDIVVGLFGFVADYKGPDIAARALLRLPRNYKLAIVGGRHPENGVDSAIDEVLADYVFDPSMAGRIRVTGYVTADQVDAYMAACDLLVSPYRDVNLSSSAAIAWALRSRRPVIATNITAFREISEKYGCLFLTGVEADAELAWAIEKVAGDPLLAESLIKGAIRYCEDRSWGGLQAAYANLYGLSVQ